MRQDKKHATTYRDAERLRQAQWIVRHQCDYTDGEIRRAARLKDHIDQGERS